MIVVDRSTRLFFDASVLIAGARSPTGGSSLLLETCRRDGFRAVTSQAVLVEVGRNLSDERLAEARERYRGYLTTIAWDLVPAPTDAAIQVYQHLIHPKDAHVLTAALESRSEFLLTLDQRDFFTEALRNAHLPIMILSPGEFIRSYYRSHPDYASLPPARGS